MFFGDSRVDDLTTAALVGNTAKVTELIHAGVNVNAKDSRGRLALHIAAHRYYGGDLVELLLAAGASVDTKNGYYGDLPLSIAASRGPDRTVRLLLASGAKVNATNHMRWTALMEAACFGGTATVETLLAAGADVTMDLEGRTALSIAAEAGYLDITGLICDAAPGRKTGYVENMALPRAIERGHLAVASRLIRFGINPDARLYYGPFNLFRGHSALELALKGNHLSVAAELVDSGATTDGVDLTRLDHMPAGMWRRRSKLVLWRTAAITGESAVPSSRVAAAFGAGFVAVGSSSDSTPDA